MAKKTDPRTSKRAALHSGFTLLEMMTSVAIITVLMSAVFSFMVQAQKRFQGNQVDVESNQSVRAAMELLSQEIGQAGYNPDFSSNKNIASPGFASTGAAQCVTLDGITQINPGDWVIVDTGPDSETVQVTGITGNGCPAASPNQIQARFLMNHNTPPPGSTFPIPVVSYKMPYPDGILYTDGTDPKKGSTDSTLEFFGDINSDGNINYVVYSLTQTTTPSTIVCIPANAPGTACAAANSYTLYTLGRSITPGNDPPTCIGVINNPFCAGAVNNLPSPLVENVLYNSNGSAPCTPPNVNCGPTGLPIFAFQTVQVGVSPNQMAAVGTVVVTLSVAVNPQSLETNTVSWHTMATQIRPLNLTAAIAANTSGGSKYVGQLPPGLPMN